MTTVNYIPLIVFQDADKAADYYRGLFAVNQRRAARLAPENVFDLAGSQFICVNVPGIDPVSHISRTRSLHFDSAEDFENAFASLSEGGEVVVPIISDAGSSLFAWVKDALGNSWQLSFVED